LRRRPCSIAFSSIPRGENQQEGRTTSSQFTSCPPGSKIKGARLEWSDKVKMKLRRRASFKWEKPPRKVLLVKKIMEKDVSAKSKEVAEWLIRRGLEVYVEPEAAATDQFPPQVKPWLPQDPESWEVDFGVVLGGDGTLLHFANLLGEAEYHRNNAIKKSGHQHEQRPLPPCISFGMGSLGFMTNFQVDHYSKILSRIIDSGKEDEEIFCTLRTRLNCMVKGKGGQLKPIFSCLNECVIDKGQHPGLGKMGLQVDGMPVTVVHGDGLIISTPSGSTGYNLAVGGAMVAPSVPCMLITPIAPSTLSFRPVIIPESSKIEVSIPYSARTDGRAIFDGHRMEVLRHGESIVVETSSFPIPVVNARPYDQDWFKSIIEKLNWNVRVEQKPWSKHAPL
jgi:NAD+ kinase